MIGVGPCVTRWITKRFLRLVHTSSKLPKYANGLKGSVSILYFPQLSLTMKTGKLLKWYASVGQQIKAYELICDISTETLTQVQNSDKSKEGSNEANVMEIEVQEDVFVAHIFPSAISQGAVLNIDEPIALLCEEQEDINRVFDLVTTKTAAVTVASAGTSLESLFPRALWQAYNKTRSESNCGGCS